MFSDRNRQKWKVMEALEFQVLEIPAWMGQTPRLIMSSMFMYQYYEKKQTFRPPPRRGMYASLFFVGKISPSLVLYGTPFPLGDQLVCTICYYQEYAHDFLQDSSCIYVLLPVYTSVRNPKLYIQRHSCFWTLWVFSVSYLDLCLVCPRAYSIFADTQARARTHTHAHRHTRTHTDALVIIYSSKVFTFFYKHQRNQDWLRSLLLEFQLSSYSNSLLKGADAGSKFSSRS